MTKIKVTQIRSVIDRPLRQKLTIDALGLGRPNWFKVHNDTPQIRGMVNKVIHLVKVEDYLQDEETETVRKKVRKTVKKPAAKTKTKTTKVKKTPSKKKKAKESE
jgi:large subunit ribosomal protein L30